MNNLRTYAAVYAVLLVGAVLMPLALVGWAWLIGWLAP